MITLEDYTLEYSLFLAEKELFENMAILGDSAINESVGLITLNESVKDTVMKYLTKISEAIQKAWEKFKSIVTNKKDSNFIESIKDKIINSNPKFTIQNYPTYNTTLLDNIKIVPFNYGEMKEVLDDKKEFIKKYYSNVFRDEEKSLSENIMDIVITGREDRKCDRTLLNDMFKGITTFRQNISKLEVDLKALNSSNTNIQSLSDQIITKNTSANESVLFYKYLTEENNAVKYEDEPGSDSHPNNKSFVKHVSNYISVSTEIITTKMKVYRNIFALNMNTLKHYIKPGKDDNGEEPSQQSVSSKTQIEI